MNKILITLLISLSIQVSDAQICDSIKHKKEIGSLVEYDKFHFDAVFTFTYINENSGENFILKDISFDKLEKKNGNIPYQMPHGDLLIRCFDKKGKELLSYEIPDLFKNMANKDVSSSDALSKSFESIRLDVPKECYLGYISIEKPKVGFKKCWYLPSVQVLDRFVY